jgi:hypothetical protein
MNRIATTTLLAALGLAAAPAFASEVLATVVSGGKAGNGIALDIVSDGGIAGFSFAIEVPGIDEKRVNLKGCAADLPSNFKGQCSVAQGKIMVIAASDNPSVTLGQGVVKVGTVYFSRAAGAKAGGDIQITGVEFSDNNAKSQPGTAKVQSN